MGAEVFVSGVAMTPFGRHETASMQDLAQTAVLQAMQDAGIESGDVQAIYCANVHGGPVLCQALVRDLELDGLPAYNVENACASGAAAVHLAMQALRLGAYDTVVVLGVEMLTRLAGSANPLPCHDGKTALFAEQGMTLPAIHGLRATRYLHEYGVEPSELARVAVKNRRHGSLNPFAQVRTETSVEEVMRSRMVAAPLTLLQCCPASVDGAAAIVLSTRRPQGFRRAVRVVASVFHSGRREHGLPNILAAGITARAAGLAYEQAGIGADALHVVELHDAFTIAELICYEALGLCGPGEGARLLASGATALGGRVPVNPSGGLLARGHPPGATGVAQLVEIAWQLQGRAGGRQVAGAMVGLAQCTAGGLAGVDHAAAGVHILSV